MFLIVAFQFWKAEIHCYFYQVETPVLFTEIVPYPVWEEEEVGEGEDPGLTCFLPEGVLGSCEAGGGGWGLQSLSLLGDTAHSRPVLFLAVKGSGKGTTKNPKFCWAERVGQLRKQEFNFRLGILAPTMSLFCYPSELSWTLALCDSLTVHPINVNYN